MKKPIFLCFLAFFAFTAPAWAQGPMAFVLEEVGQAVDNGLDVASLRRIYQVGDYAPIWKLQKAENRRALRAFLNYMEGLIEDNGLEPQGESIDLFLELADRPEQAHFFQRVLAQADGSEHADFLKLDVAITDWVLSIARELSGQALPFKEIYPGWTFEGNKGDLPEELGQALYSQKIYDFLPASAPSSLAYLHLAQALRFYRLVARQQPWEPIDPGPDLKPGDKGRRVVQLRKRLEAEAYLLPLCRSEKEERYFDDDLRRVLVDYQSRNGLETNGIVDNRTLGALNRPVDYRIDQLRANMARLRALPRVWPGSYALVNIPDASIKLFREGAVVYYAQVVLGLPSRRTPFVQSAIDTIILNPSWNIPISIARYDILPKLRKDPTYLEQKGFRIKGHRDDPFGLNIDWRNMPPRAFNYKLYQKPGKANALGAIKFDFESPFSVYLHGTPHIEDFEKARRNLSSGCVRLKNPEKLAALILETNTENRSIEAIKAKANEMGEVEEWKNKEPEELKGTNGEDMIKVEVENPLPIFIIYQTAFFPSDDISVHFRPDVYGYDNSLFGIMKKGVKTYNPLFNLKTPEETH